MVYVPVDFTCRYQVKYVPKGARIARTKYFRAKHSSLAIQKVERAEVVVAFRLHELSTMDRKITREVLLHDGRYFWPMSVKAFQFDHLTEDDLSRELRSGERDIFRQQRTIKDERFPPTSVSIEDVPMREVIDHGYERTLLACQRKARYLLICGGLAYVAAGEPLLAISKFGFLDIVAAGPDRLAHPKRDWVEHEIKDTNSRAIRAGGFFAADRGAEARQAQPAKSHRPPPEIEVLVEAPRTVSLIEIRIDSMFKDLIDAIVTAEKPNFGGSGCAMLFNRLRCERSKTFAARILKAAEEPLDSPDLTSNRLSALHECEALGLGGSIFLGHLRALFALPEVNSIMTRCLTREQDDAIAALA
jgi:hypothetical protein